jgi:basic membrane protein A
MKKLLALVMAGALAMSLVACGPKTDDSSSTPVEGDSEKTMKVCLVASNLGDKSFNDSADAGLKKAERDLGIDYTVVEYGTDNSKVDSTLLEASSEGYDMIIMNNLGFGMGTEWLKQHAKEYPDTLYLVYDEPIEKLDDENVLLMAYKANESDYLAGALAAMKSKTGVIGFVGGQEVPVIQDFLVGYIEGAQYINPDIKVAVSYVGEYANPAKGKEMAQGAITLGADVIHGVAGNSGNGALEAAKDAGLFGIGVDSDQYAIFKEAQPELADCIITSAMKEVGKSLYDVISEKINGTFVKEGDRRWFGAEGNYVGIAENDNYMANTTDEERAKIDEIKEKMASGEIVVGSAYDMTTEQIKDLQNSVAPGTK